MKFDSTQEELLSQIRHDLKNSLATVKVSTYLLAKKTKEKKFDEIPEYAKKIEDKVDELASLIDNLLSFKK